MDQAPAERTRPGAACRRFVLSALGLLLFGVAVFVVVRPVLKGEALGPAAKGEVVWLSSDEVAGAIRAGQSSQWTWLKSKLLALLPKHRSQTILLSHRFFGRRSADEIRQRRPQRAALCTNAAGVVMWKLSPAEMAKFRSPNTLDPFQNLLMLEPGGWQRQPWGLGQLDAPVVYQAAATKIGGAFQLILLLNSIPGSHSNSITGFNTMLDDGGGLLLEFPGESPCWVAVSITSMR